MPLKIYCPTCSSPNEYTLNKPLFCSMCGSKFSGIASNGNIPKPKPIQPIIAQRVSEDEEEIEGIDDSQLPDISKLELETPIDTQRSKGVIFGEVAFEQKTGFARTQTKKVDKKKEFEDFLSQAKNTRKAIDIDDHGPE